MVLGAALLHVVLGRPAHEKTAWLVGGVAAAGGLVFLGRWTMRRATDRAAACLAAEQEVRVGPEPDSLLRERAARPNPGGAARRRSIVATREPLVRRQCRVGWPPQDDSWRTTR